MCRKSNPAQTFAMKVRFIISLLLFFLSSTSIKAETASPFTADTDSTVSTKPKEKKSFGKILLAPFRWIGRNWSAYDPRYSTPSFYNWCIQLQNNSSLEWLSMNNDIVDLKIRSKVSNRFGPYFGWRWLFYGFSIDLSASNILKGNKRKNEFTLSVNSNLFNIDLIRRRTGGDFMIKKFSSEENQLYSADLANMNDVGDRMKYGIDGININYFTNHKKYSNPAAFSNGAIQFRSVGSPIIGLGYTHQKLETDIGNLFPDYIAQKNGNKIQSAEDYISLLLDAVDQTQLYLNAMPSNVTINDLHLQLGYAYNIAFSRRLLFGLSFITSPGIKWLKFDNKGTYLWEYADDLANFVNAISSVIDSPEDEEDEPLIGDDLRLVERTHNLGFDIYARASLTYNYNRWRFGINASATNLFYKHDDIRFNNNFGNAIVYAGYCFGRKKEYRYDGKNREAYIHSALTLRQIEEIKDTMPASNIHAPVQPSRQKTTYKHDVFNLGIYGCDLVKGPDGKYGTFEILDGYIPRGQDTEGRLRGGTLLEIKKNGAIEIEIGHKKSIRAGNWWKSHLNVRQNPFNWYPEMLHYALKGRLTCYVRSHTFGTMQPVKLVIDDFFLSHGTETHEFFMIGAKDFFSHSSYSITGNVGINNRLCRVYIESKKRGKKLNVYVSPLKASSREWMKYLSDDQPIAKTSLPGTHDSGTASLPESTVNSMGHTQNFTVTEQLEDGIRAFDIRLKKNMRYGHMMTCRDGFDESMVDIRAFLQAHPSEFIVALIGSDEGGKWDSEMLKNFKALKEQYADILVEDFQPTTKVGDVRGKVLVIKRQEDCPYGKLLKFQDNAVFSYDCFEVEDVYKEHKTYKKIDIVSEHLRRAYENEDPNKWFVTFNSIAWDPRHHKPYYSAWGARNVRKPMNKSLRELIEEKEYTRFGIVFLDFYSDHGDKPQLVTSIINSNFYENTDIDFIPAE